MPKNKLIPIIILLAVVLLGGFFLVRRSHTDEADSRNLSEAELKTLAWDTFTSYQNAAKSHDLGTLTSLSYQLSDTCKNKASTTECYQKMDFVASSTQYYKESDFTTMWYDDKQIVLLSDWHEEQTDLVFGDARKDLFFTRDALGNPKVLFFSTPEEVVYTLKKPGETAAKWRSELIPRIKDTDMDGSADEVETCSYPNAPKSCVKTDPTKRDTNGNGWWDTIESYFYTSTQK